MKNVIAGILFNMPHRAPKKFKPLIYIHTAVVGILILVGGLAALDWKLTTDESKVTHELNQAYATRAMLSRLMADLSYAETAQRGYILTKDSSFLDTFKTVQLSLVQQLEAFEGSHLDNDQITVEMTRQLVDLVYQRLQKLVISIQRANQERITSFYDSLVSGINLMEQARIVSAELRKRHYENITVLNQEHKRQIWRGRVTMLGLMAGIVLLIVSLVWLISVNLRHRDKIERQLRLQMARQQAMFYGAIDGLVIVNAEGIIEAMNPAALRMFKIERGNFPKNRHFATLLADNSPLRKAAFLDMGKLEYEKGGVIEVNAVQQDGEIFPADLAISEAEQNEDNFYLASFRDITERRRVDQIKNEFIATVSHELRTPLTSIAGALKLSIHNFGKEMPAKCLQLIDIAERNTQRLIKLVNDILDVEKLEAGKMAFNKADFLLKDIVVDVIDGISPMARDKKVTVQLQDEVGPVTLHTDSFRLGQVLNNLLSNAIKYSPVDETVLVNILPGEMGVRVEVCDHGPGIPESFIPLVFTKFSQASGVGYANKGGTGLGLSIVKEIVERMEGRIGFTTSPTGTVFYVELPVINRQGQPHGQV